MTSVQQNVTGSGEKREKLGWCHENRTRVIWIRRAAAARGVVPF